MQAVTITQITPTELGVLIEASVKSALENQKNNHTKTEKNWLDLKELCAYLPDKPVPTTVYGWVHNNLIPHGKGTKKLQFSKSEIDEWLKAGRKQTVAEINQEAGSYLKKKGVDNA